MTGEILFIDMETGGLDPSEHDPLTVGGIVLRQDGSLGRGFEYLIKADPERVIPTALEVNKIDLIEHNAHALEREEVARLLLMFVSTNHLGGSCLGGHNVGFDKEFARVVSPDFLNALNYHSIDTASEAFTLRRAGLIDVPNIRLGTLARFFGLIEGSDSPHSALADAILSAQVWVKMIDLLQEIKLKSG